MVVIVTGLSGILILRLEPERLVPTASCLLGNPLKSAMPIRLHVISFFFCFNSFNDSDDEASSIENGGLEGDAGSTDEADEADERTSLLPPPGMGTHEQREVKPSHTKQRLPKS